jgi:hypothetical protein
MPWPGQELAPVAAETSWPEAWLLLDARRIVVLQGKDVVLQGRGLAAHGRKYGLASLPARVTIHLLTWPARPAQHALRPFILCTL